MPNEVFENENFQLELAHFLSCPDPIDSDIRPPSPHSQFITALLMGILRAVGRAVDTHRITKRVRDKAGSLYDGSKGWRRSPLWLLIRIAIQMSVDRSPLGRTSYKKFMLYFICTLAGDGNKAYLSNDLLQLMSFKILRRLSKLDSSSPEWLSEVALKVCHDLGDTLNSRWKQLSARTSPFSNPSQDQLIEDTQTSLLGSGEYIRNALANPASEVLDTLFHPYCARYGTFEDLLSSNGLCSDKKYDVHPFVTIYDVERLVEQGIDDWLACVTNVDDACAQLEILMDKYITEARKNRRSNPEDSSIRFLTQIELLIAVDKLVVKEIPMLIDYSPEVPVDFDRLLLRKTTSLHRLFCASQYLSARHSQARPGWSVFSTKLTEDSFSVRYYSQSMDLQRLKARIEEDAMKKASQSPLPASPLDAKAVVFELQCPACVRIWRSIVSRLCYSCYPMQTVGPYESYRLLADDPALQPYFLEDQGPRPSVGCHSAYFYQRSSHS